jgi:predicted porin
MKKPLIAAAISMALVGTAQAESQFYGKMNVATVYDDSSEKFSLSSNASRLGVKGSDDLGSTKVIYQAEFELSVDDGLGTDFDEAGDTDTNTLKTRDTYIGLAYSGMGTVKMGIMDTPLKKSQGKFDQFNDVIDIKNVLDGENRMANSINYTSEKMANTQVSVSAVLAENGSSDGYSASVVYSADSLYLSGAYDTKIKGESTQRVTAIFKAGDLSFGALINNVDTDDTKGDDELGYAANIAMKAGSNTFKAQYEAGDQKAAGATSLSLGLDHKLAKTTKAFFYVNQSETDAVDSDVTALVAGLEHKF